MTASKINARIAARVQRLMHPDCYATNPPTWHVGAHEALQIAVSEELAQLAPDEPTPELSQGDLRAAAAEALSRLKKAVYVLEAALQRPVGGDEKGGA